MSRQRMHRRQLPFKLLSMHSRRSMGRALSGRPRPLLQVKALETPPEGLFRYLATMRTGAEV